MGRNGNQLNEVFISEIKNPQPIQITKFTDQVSGWKVAQSEVISWKSKDGATIEGVLHKPANYDPAKNTRCWWLFMVALPALIHLHQHRAMYIPFCSGLTKDVWSFVRITEAQRDMVRRFDHLM